MNIGISESELRRRFPDATIRSARAPDTVVRAPRPRRQKYNAQPTVVDGVRFASKKEARRYSELKLLMQSGEVRWFAIQPQFVLEGGVKYVADFLILWRDGSVTVEDTEGVRTPAYRDKKKQVKARYGIDVVEV